jgi:hypothetical protein
MQNFIPTLDLPRNLLCPRTLSLAVTSCLIPELRRPLTSPDLDEASLLPSPPRWAPLSHVIHHQWTGLPHSPLLLEATGPHCWSPPPSPSTGHRRIEPLCRPSSPHRPQWATAVVSLPSATPVIPSSWRWPCPCCVLSLGRVGQFQPWAMPRCEALGQKSAKHCCFIILFRNSLSD